MPIFRRNNCTNTASGILALLGGCTLHRLRADIDIDIILHGNLHHFSLKTLSHDSRQHMIYSYSSLPCTGFYTFLFNILKLILGLFLILCTEVDENFLLMPTDVCHT